MYSKSGKNSWIMLIFILAGIVIGGLIGEALPKAPYLNWLKYGQTFGLSSPLLLDIGILNLTFGLTVTINIAGIIGIVLAVIIYRRMK